MTTWTWSYFGSNIYGAEAPSSEMVKPRNRRALWTKRRARKDTRCCACGVRITKGHPCYAPITNSNYRMRRGCVPCVEGVE